MLDDASMESLPILRHHDLTATMAPGASTR
jgi:hypothetical protein